MFNLKIFIILLCFGINSIYSDYRLFNNNGSVDTLMIIAPMFEFQKDSITNTAFDGKFIQQNSLSIEKAPHNSEYFTKNFEYIKNYFYKVSDSNLVIKYRVLPIIGEPYKLPHKISYYSPNDVKLKDDSLMVFCRDAINILGKDREFLNYYNSQKSQENSNYKVALAIIYAGASLFTDGVVTGVHNSPWDIANAFIRPVDFERYSNIISKNNILNVDRIMLVPEQASQDSLEFKQAKMNYFEMSTHSMVVYETYKLLGAPDLSAYDYSTKYGDELTSFVGVFSPLDIASFFSLKSAGLFSVNPGAWEREYFGWSNIKNINVGDTLLVNSSEILKAVLNDNEYYLFDLRTNGQNTNISYYLDNQNSIVTQSFNKNDFYNLDTNSGKISQKLPNGIVVNIENSDLFLPSSGVLAWKINKSVINKYINQDKINNRETNEYGVDLIEKDGNEDVGYNYFYDYYGNKISQTGDSSDFFKSGDSLLLLGSDNKNSHTFIKILDISKNSFKVTAYNNLITYKNILDNAVNIDSTFLDTIEINNKEYYINDNKLFTEERLIYSANKNIKKVIPVKEGSDNYNLLLLLDNGSLNYITQLGNDVPNYGLINDVKNIFVCDSGNSNKILVFDNEKFTIYNSDFSINHSYYQKNGVNIRLDDFPVPYSYSNIDYINSRSIISKQDSIYKYFNLNSFVDSIIGLNGEYNITLNSSNIFNYKSYVYPNPIKRVDKNLNLRFYSNKSVTNFNTTIYSFTGKVISSKNSSVVVGWNRVVFDVSNYKDDVYLIKISFKYNGKNYQLYKRFAVRG